MSELEQCALISTSHLQELKDRRAVAHLVQLCSVSEAGIAEIIPDEIQQVLKQFGSVFDEPSGLSPSSVFDHSIPLFQELCQ